MDKRTPGIIIMAISIALMIFTGWNDQFNLRWYFIAISTALIFVCVKRRDRK